MKPVLGGNYSRFVGGSEHGGETLGIAVGMEGEYRFSSQLGLSLVLMYSAEGCGSSGGSSFYWGGENRYYTLKRMQLMKMPVLANIRLIKFLHLQLGLEPSYVIKLKSSAPSGSSFDHKRFFIGLPVGLRLAFPHFEVSLRYSYGLEDVCYDNHSSTFSLLVGIPIGK